MNLEWRVLRLSSAPIDFVLADTPITMWGDGDIQRVWMPLSPDALFVAGDHNYFLETPELYDDFRPLLPIEVARYQFTQAREFVIGKDEGEEKIQALLRIAERHLRKHKT